MDKKYWESFYQKRNIHQGYCEKIMTPLQKHVYEIMVVIDRLCEEHGIPYFLSFGTALGALRHKGFIPWDDDADIGMLRPDYERFLKLCAEKLPDGYSLQHFSVDKHVYVAFAKILDTRTRVRAEGVTHPSVRQHVYLDIFPVDRVPKSALKRRLQLVGLRLLHGLLEIKYVNHAAPNWRNKMLVWFLRPLLPSGCVMAGAFDRLSAWGEKQGSNEVWQAEAPYAAERTTYPLEWVSKRRRARFEHGEFWIPAEAEKCMEKTYGDYMTPPPPEKRPTHGRELLLES